MNVELAVTELTFLIQLLLHHELKKETKDVIAARIGVVESNYHHVVHRTQVEQQTRPLSQPGAGSHGASTNVHGITYQAPSTLALMAKHGDIPPVATPVMPPVEPVTQIAHTPQAAAAMNSRNAAIADSIAGKVDKVSGKPRKW